MRGLVWIKGAGDLATGVAYRLHMAGFGLILTELEQPLCVRRRVCLAEAIPLGRHSVESLVAVRVSTAAQARAALADGLIPVAPDPAGELARALGPGALVDAVMAKRNTGTAAGDAPLVVGLGPGFTAGEDCHAVVETQRGHRLGRALYRGAPAADTGMPGEVNGITAERVLRAPACGRFRACREIGETVAPQTVLGSVTLPDGASAEVRTAIGGVIRGLLRTGTPVVAGLKVGDVDPTFDQTRCDTISDKALAVGGGVLEALLHLWPARR